MPPSNKSVSVPRTNASINVTTASQDKQLLGLGSRLVGEIPSHIDELSPENYFQLHGKNAFRLTGVGLPASRKKPNSR